MEKTTELKYKAYITYPRSQKSTEYVFKVNTDDHLDPKPIDAFLKSKGIQFKRIYQQHKHKCIGWHVYKVKSETVIKSFEENVNFVEKLFHNTVKN
jgi:hypothetical protein